jgi:hypothetical protein
VTRPEEALERAREAAARKRAAGGYPDAGAPAPPARLGPDQLAEWAVIEADPRNVYSTRRAGAPITALKQLLLRLLKQYTNEIEAKQTRFNLVLLGMLHDLEARVAELERRRDPGDGE